jgi:hypothetical protein
MSNYMTNIVTVSWKSSDPRVNRLLRLLAGRYIIKIYHLSVFFTSVKMYLSA